MIRFLHIMWALLIVMMFVLATTTIKIVYCSQDNPGMIEIGEYYQSLCDK